MIPIYWGIFVDNMDGQLENVIKYQHVTFGFHTEYPEKMHGLRFPITIIGYGNDGKNEALLVELPKSVIDMNIYGGADKPHITLSVSSDAKPVDSWKLHFQFVWPWTIWGVFGYFDKDGVHT